MHNFASFPSAPDGLRLLELVTVKGWQEDHSLKSQLHSHLSLIVQLGRYKSELCNRMCDMLGGGVYSTLDRHSLLE